MVNTLMGTSSENPFPSQTSDKDLAEEFADFFMDKIQKIRDNLTGYPTYEPTKKITTRLAEFRPFEQTEVKKIIFSMKFKIMRARCITNKTIETMHRRYFANYNQFSKHFTAGGYVCI